MPQGTGYSRPGQNRPNGPRSVPQAMLPGMLPQQALSRNGLFGGQGLPQMAQRFGARQFGPNPGGPAFPNQFPQQNRFMGQPGYQAPQFPQSMFPGQGFNNPLLDRRRRRFGQPQTLFSPELARNPFNRRFF